MPAILAALGVALLTAGLLTYTAPVEAGPEPSQSPTIVTLAPTVAPSFTAHAGDHDAIPGPDAAGGPRRDASRGQGPRHRPAGGPKPPSDTAYPFCDVAMYIQDR